MKYLSPFGPWARYQGLFGLTGCWNQVDFTVHFFPRANKNRWGRQAVFMWPDDNDEEHSWDLGPFFSVIWSYPVLELS